MNAQHALHRYQTVDVQTATPEDVLLRLLDGAVAFVDEGQSAIMERELEIKGRRLMQAVAIVDELQAALDPSHAPELVDNLHNLYNFVRARLLEANMHLDPRAAGEAARILVQIRSGFRDAVRSLR